MAVTEEIAVSDIAEGDTVSVMGDTNGSTVTATSIRVGDLGTGAMGGPGGAPSAASDASASGTSCPLPTIGWDRAGGGC